MAKIRHGSAVSAVKFASEHQLLVAGLKDSLRLYDTRFVKKTASNGASVVQYHGYANTHTPQTHLSVLSSGSHFAVSSGVYKSTENTDNCTVQFYHTVSGHRVFHDSLDQPSNQPCVGVAWVGDEQRLIKASKNAVAYYAWGRS